MRNLFDGWHIVVLAVVILLLFGWKKMPDMARSLAAPRASCARRWTR
ncbi:twin-arginine translocase TatA/TatE family subunit [Allobranchiibius sp. GilTou73]|nr:twin-arginine translocase TatA/TatE family subunit [Allobranchiibius sp. GilTou73]UIJ33979.1 twin-arginine translocase TatA/TatE family subunit [Allobranchiibius sp. GilTou73]